MRVLERHSLERRILEYLQAHYPVSARQLAGSLGVSEKRVLLELRRMASKGMVELDVLPDTVFVRCLVVLAGGTGHKNGEDGPGDRKGQVRGKNGKGKEGGDALDPAYR